MKTFVVTDPQIIEETIAKTKICFLGMVQPDGAPYVIPMCFGFRDNTFYFHSGNTGSKLDILARNPHVCISLNNGESLIFQHPDVACSYSMVSHSIVAHGEAVFVEDFDEKREALNIIMQHYTGRSFKYGVPAVNNVSIWKVKAEKICCKSFGNRAKRRYE